MNETSISHKSSLTLLTLSALGVVFGDIATSPLYALKECFSAKHGLLVSPENVLGVLSMIVWTLVIVVCFKYMLYIMRADNHGEGGILSLTSLVTHVVRRSRFFFVVGVFGAALLYGDGVITPAISVLSAVEGLQVMSPHLHELIVPITIVIIFALFWGQKYGTGRIGIVFGPLILLWLVTIGFLGVMAIIKNTIVLQAFSPIYAFQFIYIQKEIAIFVLGSVFLVVTGAEALYADMGHFGKNPIRIAWFLFTFPALILNYFGQGALVLGSPEAVANPFYLLAPPQFQSFLVVISTTAAIIASQALISGVFSLTRQAIQLGLLPRLQIVHTSLTEIGQIYIPSMNWALFGGIVWLVIDFRSSENLASAYGLAVTSTMLITNILAAVVARRIWKWSWFRIVVIFGIFGCVDSVFLFSNSVKFLDGGWIPVLLALFIYFIMSTWRRGRTCLFEQIRKKSVSEKDFFEHIKLHPPIARIPGSAIFMSGDRQGIPITLLHNLKHNRVLHETTVFLNVKTLEIPTVPQKDRIQIESLGNGFYWIVAFYGFMQTPKMKYILEASRGKGLHLTLSETTFVLGRETILPTQGEGMAIWRERIFAIMTRNAERPARFFRIPPNQVIEVGIQVEI